MTRAWIQYLTRVKDARGVEATEYAMIRAKDRYPDEVWDIAIAGAHVTGRVLVEMDSGVHAYLMPVEQHKAQG